MLWAQCASVSLLIRVFMFVCVLCVCICVISGNVPGMRPAEAGEFTRRAFQAGKMGLTEVVKKSGKKIQSIEQHRFVVDFYFFFYAAAYLGLIINHENFLYYRFT